jgi:DNA adenine methylase
LAGFEGISGNPQRLVRGALEQAGRAWEKEAFEEIKRNYNRHPNGADLLFICRACYGGVVRFRQKDGHISTPCGIHDPISPASFARRLVYCDPPYSHTQAILYGAQSFSLEDLFTRIANCKKRGVRVALSIDGTKKSGKLNCPLPIPEGLFERQVFIDCGRSMLRRFQMTGRSLEQECIADRLLLTY